MIPADSNEANRARYARLERFFASLQSDIYPEPPSELHTELTQRMFAWLRQEFSLPAAARVLDIGCGQGAALALFAAAGFVATGIALGRDVDACRAQGYDVRAMDFSFLDFDDQSFDLVWCRHALEHSIFPLFTLAEIFRVTRPGGVLYVEVPAPDTACNHEGNRNHYSVLGKRMWIDLIRRTGFTEILTTELHFRTGLGADHYLAFMQRRPAAA